MTTHDEHFLRLAIKLASEARTLGADPFGAVLVREGVVLSQARDRSVEVSDPTYHAELAAISAYCRERQIFSLEGCTLYCSAEPCPMCAGAIHWARITRVVYSVSQAMLQGESGGRPKPACEPIVNMGNACAEVLGPLLPDEGLAVFKDYAWTPKLMRHQALFRTFG